MADQPPHSEQPDIEQAFMQSQRTQSWHSVSSYSSADHSSPSHVALQPVNLLDRNGKRLLNDDSELQLWWDQEMCRELKLPPGYRNVAVLLIKWSPDIDEFKERGEKEVGMLKDLFEKSFNYKTVLLSLTANHHRSPEEYLKHKIRKLMKQHDSANDLLIVYYSGHGSFYNDLDPAEQFLELHATKDFDSRSGLHPAKLNWNNVENILIKEGKADMLVIMDACFAGNLNVSATHDLGRAYEVLGACKRNRTTASPGPHSFTHILHKSLESLIGKYSAFTTANLLSEILEGEERRNNPPEFWSRSINTARHIRLAPVPSQPHSEHAGYFDDQPIPQYLTLRVELKDRHRPSRDEIEQLAYNISKAVRNSSIRTRRIDCMGLTAKTSRSLRTAAQMISSLVRLMGPRKSQSNPGANLDSVSKSLNEDRKRPRQDDGSDLEDEPRPKRQASGNSQRVFDSPRPMTPNSGVEG